MSAHRRFLVIVLTFAAVCMLAIAVRRLSIWTPATDLNEFGIACPDAIATTLELRPVSASAFPWGDHPQFSLWLVDPWGRRTRIAVDSLGRAQVLHVQPGPCQLSWSHSGIYFDAKDVEAVAGRTIEVEYDFIFD